jgi:hypothetical protein
LVASQEQRQDHERQQRAGDDQGQKPCGPFGFLSRPERFRGSFFLLV